VDANASVLAAMKICKKHRIGPELISAVMKELAGGDVVLDRAKLVAGGKLGGLYMDIFWAGMCGDPWAIKILWENGVRADRVESLADAGALEPSGEFNPGDGE
jgi:hypothetical protein